MLLPTPRTAPLPRAGVPLVGELNRGDLRGDAPESELEGVAGRLDPLAGEPQAGDLCLLPDNLTPNMFAALLRSESESKNLGDRRLGKVANV